MIPDRYVTFVRCAQTRSVAFHLPMTFILLTTFFFIPNLGKAQSSTWSGLAGDLKWENDVNWTNGVPGAGDTAVLNNLNLSPTFSTNPTVFAYLSNNSVLRIGPTTTFSVTTRMELDNQSSLVNQGRLKVGIDLICDSSTINNMGTIEPGLIANPDLTVSGLSDFTNQDSIIDFNVVIANESLWTNDGLILGSVTGGSNKNMINNGQIFGHVWIYGGFFLNDGLIHHLYEGPVGRVGIFIGLTGKFINNDSIVIENIVDTIAFSSECVGLAVQGIFFNNATAKIFIKDIKHPNTTKSTGIELDEESNFQNFGLIELEDLNGVGIRSHASSAINTSSGIIRITNMSKAHQSTYAIALEKASFFANSGTFRNSGQLFIDSIGGNSDGFGVFIKDTFAFINHGLLEINECTKTAIENDHTGSDYDHTGIFKNMSAGTVHISFYDHAFTYYHGICCVAINEGLINIDSGFFLTGVEGVIINTNTININIASAGGNQNGIKGLILNQAGASVYSSRRITIDSLEGTNGYGPSFNEGEMATDLPLYVDAAFTNMACGKLTIHRYGSSAQGPMVNEGYILVHGLDDPFEPDPMAALLNTGVICDANGVLSGEPMIINNGIYMQTIPGSYECLDVVNNVCTGTNSAGILNPQIYVDVACSITAGNFDVPSHQISLGVEVSNSDTLYAHFETSALCNFVVPIFFENTITCVGCPLNSWSGSTSTDWHVAGNWSEAQVPSDCQEVRITTGQECTITNGNMAECRLLEVAVGNTFSVNGQLEVKPN